jgi:pSer/pThr/pTyr-binding forkhead associated (FHA) protein
VLRPNQQIILEVQGSPIRMLLVDNMSILLGRADVNVDPDIDLTLYGGVERGVSRVHARIQFRDGKLYITDLGSNNGTYIGDRRLDAHRPEVLRVGQTIMLGRLVIKLKTPE